jgi:hypothetical protein
LEYYIKMDVDEIEWENVGCIQMIQDKFHLRAFCKLGNERSSFTKSHHFSFQVRQHSPFIHNSVLHMVTHKKRL